MQVNIAYSHVYLRQLMINHDDNDAANILIREIGSQTIKQAAQTFGAKNTTLTGKFGQPQVGTTTADDLAIVMSGLYQGKVFGQVTDNQILSSLAVYPNKGLAAGIPGSRFAIGDPHAAVALVKTGSQAYVMSAVVAQNEFDFAGLGNGINNFFLNSQK